jgi:RNA polymerase sigma-70 factor (ECF subfamily)
MKHESAICPIDVVIDTNARYDRQVAANQAIDAELLAYLQGMIRKDEIALGHFYDATCNWVYGVALRIAQNAALAEEIVSDVYMQSWRDADKYDSERGRVLAWLLVITRSRALDTLRRRDEAFSHPDPHQLVDESLDTINCPQDLLELTQTNRLLQQAIARLSPIQRQVLTLSFFRGMSHSEIATLSGLALGSVKTHVRKAISVLRESLGPEFEVEAQ